MKIGWIGLGIMGKPMAKNLLKAGYRPVVYDLNADAVRELAACGAEPASCVCDVAAQADVLITMLPNSPQVKQVILEKGGAIEALRAGAVVIDCSSINPIASREIAAALAQKGVDMLDAPVSGGETKAIDGTLAFMVGGKEETFNQYKDILYKMGASVVLCGGIGAGNVTKLCNQIIVASNIAAVAEAFTLGKLAGVEPETIYRAIRNGLAGSTVMESKGPMMINGNFAPGFRIDLHIKDLNNVVDAAGTVSAPIPMTRRVLDMMRSLHDSGDGGCDHSALYKYYQGLTEL